MSRSPYTKPNGVRLPALQALRLQDPQAQKAIEALREHVEVRLGNRGDPYEKAVTLREFEQRLAETFAKIGALGSFNGTLETLRATPLAALPETVSLGAFVLLDNGDLYVGATASAWKKVTLT